MEHVFFNGWEGPQRTLVIGVLAYLMLVLFLRVAGKRTLSKMNAFDMVVTIALGSTLASILLSKDVSLLQGGVAMGLLIGLQYAVTWSSVRVGWVRRVVTSEPSLLLFQGALQHASLRRCRVTEAELRVALRQAGLVSFSQVQAIVLENDASFTVIACSQSHAGVPDALADVHGAAQE